MEAGRRSHPFRWTRKQMFGSKASLVPQRHRRFPFGDPNFSKWAGLKVEEILMVWDRSDKWFDDCPVIVIAGGKWEFLANKSMTSFSVNSIDLGDLDLWMRRCSIGVARHPIYGVKGERIKEVGILEYFTSTGGGSNIGSTDYRSSVDLFFDTTELQIFNGLEITGRLMKPESVRK